MAETITRPGTIEHLDFEPELPCEETLHDPCDSTVEFYGIWKCCGALRLYCLPHTMELVEALKGPDVIEHRACGTLPIETGDVLLRRYR